MNNIRIYSSDENFDFVTIESDSKISAVKATRKALVVSIDLDKPGVYILFLADKSVYVGQSSSIGSRIFNSHTNQIQDNWVSFTAFTFPSDTSNNYLLFLENTLCEYAHKHYPCCRTSVPTRANCNASYRSKNYNLNAGSINICNQYFQDINTYLSILERSPDTEIFTFTSKARDSSGTAEISIHCARRKTILKAGSRISKEVSENFAGSQRVQNQRKKYLDNGVIVDRILQKDIEFNSPSGAGEFLNGTSFDGNTNWRTSDGRALKDLL